MKFDTSDQVPGRSSIVAQCLLGSIKHFYLFSLVHPSTMTSLLVVPSLELTAITTSETPTPSTIAPKTAR
jgi:hypothetical protein